jgi:RecB family exonuclease
VPLAPVILITPSQAAAVELPRRLAAAAGARAGIVATKPLELARAIAEPALLGRGLHAWDSGHDALLAARLLAGPHGLRLPERAPRARIAAALARTLGELRRAGVEPARVARVEAAARTGEDAIRLRAVAALYAAFDAELEARFADPARLLREAAALAGKTDWLREASVLVVGEPELEPLERALLAALRAVADVRWLGDGAERHGVRAVGWADSALAPIAPPEPPPSIARLRERLFAAPREQPVTDAAVELLTAPGEAAETRAIVRRMLREAARGMRFEEMGVILPQPDPYAPLFADLLERLGIPFRLHPSLPLRFGRAARSLLLLFRCRGLGRSAVMEFLTFAPVPYAEILGPEREARPARWDEISRDAGIVSDLARWLVGLRRHAEEERAGAAREAAPERRERRLERAQEAERLLRVVELLNQTHELLSGEASWPEWSSRLQGVVLQWVGPERDTEAVAEVVADLAALGSVQQRVPWPAVEDVVEARFEWERMPLVPAAGGAVHVGALDAMAGLPFRLVAIPGLVEGGFPGTLRPDPFLLDAEREALAEEPAPPAAAPAAGRRRRDAAQLPLFDDAARPATRGPRPIPTSQDRLEEARRAFRRAIGQASERLILSYPRADPRTGRERLPSLFFAAAASTLEGRPLVAAALDRLVGEDAGAELPLELALDRGERDRARVARGGREAVEAVAAGSRFFRQSRLAAQARWSHELTPYDGLVAWSSRDPLAAETAALVRARLDPLEARAISASRFAVYARCGFQYLLQHVLKLEPALVPEERLKLEPLERGLLFHHVAEAFLRELRDGGRLPVEDDEKNRARLVELGRKALDEHVAGSPPRFVTLWEREQRRFEETLLGWLEREAAAAERATPRHFEVGFGPSVEPTAGEPHLSEPLEIPLGDGRVLRVSGKIDRIDERPDGSLLLRDYKTGKAPRDEAGVFRGGKQLQIPFYILAAEKLFPGRPVTEAFLDYVDGGRQVAFNPELVRDEGFRKVLRSLVDSIAAGAFLQEHTSCDFCEFTVVCGPKPLLARRRQWKLNDTRVQNLLRIRSL